MILLLSQTLPFALLACLSPVLILVEIVILSSKKHAVSNALRYVLGASIVLFLLGALFFSSFNSVASKSAQPNVYFAIADFVFAGLLLLLLFKPASRKKKKLKAPKSKWAYYSLGGLMMLTNVSSLIPYAAMVKFLAQHKSMGAEVLAIFVLNTLIVLLPIVLPVLYCLVLPKNATSFLKSLQDFMNKYNHRITQVFLVVISIYLLYHGVTQL